jgi:hypothetical protein
VLQRTILAASAIVFAVSMSPAAQAGCGGCGFEAAPAAYAEPVYAQPAPVYAQPAYVEPAPVYAPPLAMPAPVPAPFAVAPAPIAVDHWDTGGCGGFGGSACGGGFGFGFGGLNGCNCGRAAGYAPSPLYVVNQGPVYSGPGMMLPYRTYAPAAAFAPGINYPYIGRRYGYRGPGFYRYGAYRGPRFAYRASVYVHPRYYRARPYLYR